MFPSSLFARSVGVVLVLVPTTLAVFITGLLTTDAYEANTRAHTVDGLRAQVDGAVQRLLHTRDIDHAHTAWTALETVDSLMHLPAGRDDVRVLADEVARFKVAVDTLVVALVRRGLDETSGAEGRFRQRVLELEDVVRSIDEPRMLVHLSMARRHEKNFLKLRDPKYVPRVHSAALAVQEVARRSAMPSVLQRRLATRTDAYRAEFDRLVQEVDRVAAAEADVHILGSALQENTQALVATQSARANRYRMVTLGILVLGLCVGLLLAYLVARSVARPIQKLEAAARRIVRGEAPQVDIDRRDELGALAQAFNRVSLYIEEQRQAQAALQTAHQFSDTVLFSLDEGVIVCDEAGQIRRVNRYVEEEMGLTDAVGKRPIDVFPDLDSSAIDATFARARSGETVPPADVLWRDPVTGEKRWFATLTSALRDADGAVVGTVSILRDATERRLYEQHLIGARDEAEMLANLRQALLDNLGHEIRTPLTTIIGFSQMLEDVTDPAEIAEFAGMIGDDGRRLMDTLNAVLHLSEIESGALTLDAAPVPVADAVAEALGHAADAADRRGLTLTPDVPSELAVRADRTALVRVFDNLISNAVKFTERGTITITARVNDGWCEIAVCDTGCGIAPQFLPAAFEPFRQASAGNDRTHEGNGLGLTVAQKLVALMGGHLHAESELGRGTVIKVVLPTAAVPAGSLAA